MHKSSYVLVLIASFSGLAADAATVRPSDLVAPQKRQTALVSAERLHRLPDMAPLPDDLADPFNPPGFDAPPPEAAKAPKAEAVRPSATPIESPKSDREVLEKLAALIPQAGIITQDDKAMITFGAKRISEGQIFRMSYNNRDYDLQIVAIGTSTFTVRYRDEELTRSTRQAAK
jgi:hypothetical protein